MPHPSYSTRPAQFIIECRAADNYPIGRRNLLDATYLYSSPIIPLAGAIYCMPHNYKFLLSLWQQQAHLISYLTLLGTPHQSWYIPTDCTNERFNCWPAHILPHPLKAHGIPDHDDCWASTTSRITWALSAHECPVFCTCQGWFAHTYPYLCRQSQVLQMLTVWIETFMLLPSPIPIPQTQAQLR